MFRPCLIASKKGLVHGNLISGECLGGQFRLGQVLARLRQLSNNTRRGWESRGREYMPKP
jgi:fructosamine-3-kinase